MKIHSTTVFIIFLAILAVLLGYNYFATPFYNRFHQPQQLATNDEKFATDAVDPLTDIFDQLSSDQKIGLLMSYPYIIGQESEDAFQPESDSQDNNLEETTISHSSANGLSAQQTALKNFQPGFILFFGSDIPLDLAQQEIDRINQIFEESFFHPLYLVDHEGRGAQRFSGEGFTLLSPWREMCEKREVEQLDELISSATELRQLGINIVLAPVLDVDSSVLGSRSCADGAKTFSAAKKYIEVFGNHQIIPVVKHFPGLGSLTKDLHFSSDVIDFPKEEIEIFAEIFDLYPNIGVMTSHVQLENRLQNLPCSLSQDCILSFSQSYPDLLVFSDALDMRALASFEKIDYWPEINEADQLPGFDLVGTQAASLRVDDSTEFEETNLVDISFGGLSRISYLALLAGNDVLLYGRDVEFEEFQTIRQDLVQVYEKDASFAQQVDQSVMKILSLRY